MAWTRFLRRNDWHHERWREIESYLEIETDQNITRGMPPDEARYAARRKLGNLTRVREEIYRMNTIRFIETLWQDVRFALRMLRKSPGFTAIAILTLGVGIGANTAVFSVVYGVLLKPLPFANPNQLVSLFEANPQKGIPVDAFSYPNFLECRDHNRAFSEMAGYNAHDLTLTGAGEPATVHTVAVTREMFSLLGVKPLAGRGFYPEDGQRGASPVVILSEDLWRSRFGANRNLIGRSITLDMRSFTVVGIMPGSFRFPLDEASGDIWIPVVQDPLWSGFMSLPAGVRWLITVGRLKRGVSIEQARANMEILSAGLTKQFPSGNAGWTIGVETLQEETVGEVRSALLVLLGAVGLVLLIACANIANLLLARATSRAREIALRIALGAAHRRITRQLFTESVLLGLVGGTASILVAYWGVHSLTSVLPPDLPRARTIHVDGWVLAFALALSAAASILFGLAPALFAAGSSVQASLSQGAARSGEGGAGRRLRNLLAAAEIALAMVLLVAAGLLIRSFTALTSVYPGFNARHVVTAEISLPQYQYSKPAQWTAFAKEFMDRIHAQPGLRDSAIGIPLPIAYPISTVPFSIVGNPPLPPRISLSAQWESVSPGYFHVMEIPLLRGRSFTPQDSPITPPVAVISAAFARRYFPSQDPLGKRLKFEVVKDGVFNREIIGIVGDVRGLALSKAPDPMMYVPYAQAPVWGGIVVVRSRLDTPSVAAAVRHVTRQIDRDLPVTNIETFSEALSASVAQPRFRSLLLGLFGAIALVLATVGIFGVISYSVSRRTHEIGIRMALGATPASVLRLILAESGRLVLLGLAVGIPAALVLTRFLSSFLFAVHPADPLTFTGVAILLAAVALAASYFPARRALRVDPTIALREL
jgi:putative ABC transport system permease protein